MSWVLESAGRVRLKKESRLMRLGVVGVRIALSITKMEAAEEGNCAKGGNRIV